MEDKQSLKQYIQFIIDYGGKQIDNQIINQAKVELFGFIDLKKVCEDIQKEIIVIYRKDIKYNKISIPQYIQSLTQSSPEEKSKIAQEFSSLGHNQIRAIVQRTIQVVDKINEELNCFAMEVST